MRRKSPITMRRKNSLKWCWFPLTIQAITGDTVKFCRNSF